MIVLDASALVDVVSDRPSKAAVLSHIDRQHILAPGHQLAEVSSAIVRLVRAGELDQASAERALGDAASLVQEVIPANREQLMRAWALRDTIRVLHGIYVAIAETHGCPLVTTDGRLARSNPPCDVILAGEPVDPAASR